MKRWFVSGLAALLMTVLLAEPNANAVPSPAARAHSGGNFGLGVSLVDPLGLSAKLFLTPNHALQWHVAWLPFHHRGGGISMDYLFHPVTLASGRYLNLVPYFGAGLGFAFWDHDRRSNHYDGRVGLYLRLLGGLAIHWKKVPLDTVLETGWTPFLIEEGPDDFGPAYWDLSIKVRYYF
jgi:hypothetical protein